MNADKTCLTCAKRDHNRATPWQGGSWADCSCEFWQSEPSTGLCQGPLAIPARHGKEDSMKAESHCGNCRKKEGCPDASFSICSNWEGGPTANISPRTWTGTSSCAPAYYVVMPQEGWHCPRCNAINAPDVKQCPCSPPHEDTPACVPINPLVPQIPKLETVCAGHKEAT